MTAPDWLPDPRTRTLLAVAETSRRRASNGPHPRAASVRGHHRKNYQRDKRIAAALAEGLSPTHAARKVGATSPTVATGVRDRITADKAMICAPCPACQKLRSRWHERLTDPDLTIRRVGRADRSHEAVLSRAKRRGLYLIRRGDRYAVIDPDTMLTLDQAADVVDSYRPTVGAPVGQIPTSPPDPLAGLRREAVARGLVLIKRGESYFLIPASHRLTLSQVKASLNGRHPAPGGEPLPAGGSG